MDILFVLFILLLALYLFTLIQKSNKKTRNRKNKFPRMKINRPEKEINPSKYPPEEELPYRIKPLLTNAEYKFYYYLKTACDKMKFMVCPKVRMEDIISISSKNRRTINRFRGYIRARHLDFVICDDQMKAICAIELDDASHNTEKAKNVDQFKDDVCKKIGIKLYRVKTSSNYMEKITEIIQDIYKTNAATRTAASGNTTPRTNTATANRTTTNNTAARTNAAAANRNYTRTTSTATNKTTTGNTPNRTAPTRATTTRNPATRTNSN